MKHWYFLWKSATAEGWGIINSVTKFFPLKLAQACVIHGGLTEFAGADSSNSELQNRIAIKDVIQISENDFDLFEYSQGKF